MRRAEGSKRTICGECQKAPVRGPRQYYCRACQTQVDKANKTARQEELKRLRIEVEELRKRLDAGQR